MATRGMATNATNATGTSTSESPNTVGDCSIVLKANRPTAGAASPTGRRRRRRWVLELADAIGTPYRAMVLLARFAGLRTGESLGLRRADIDPLHGEIRIHRQAQEVTGCGRAVLAPKSEAGRRTVALPAVVVESLEQHSAAFTSTDAEAPVFTGPKSGPLRRATFSRAWRAAVSTTGAPAGLRPHDLRTMPPR